MLLGNVPVVRRHLQGIWPICMTFELMKARNSNRVSYNMDSRPCKKDEYHVCTPDECDPSKTFAGEDSKRICAQSGCDHNPYRLQNTEFYGPNKTVDTTKPFT